MPRWAYYRLPIVFCAIAGLELVRASLSTPEDVARVDLDASRTLESLYPDMPRSIYQQGLRSLQARDYAGAQRSFETALAARYYTDEGLLHNYALLLIHLGHPGSMVDQAVELWRKHFPHSKNPDPRWYARLDRRP